ncbi:carboxylesterase family protein [Pareuzebyella sediminis]|uniref:carboxylesterase family protein n=1 Tax=Pareuzebyella sediminis TaxID=2607998 RepID=UPI0011ED819A|nr:prolyl oligopeptidase family serine peptidase [Pareuzebyella sediminis]
MRLKIHHVLLMLSFQSCASQSKPNLIDNEFEAITKEKFNYYLYYPDDYDTEEEKEFPLLLFLHGGGESGAELGAIKRNGPPKLIASGKKFPFLILAPQNPHKKKWWNIRALMKLLDSVISNNRVDKKRIYLTGLSRGGGAAWELAVQYPEKFAAMAVVCGMAPTPYASWIDKRMPIWVFHGEEDQSIPISESEEMVDKLKEMGHDIRFTRYPGVGHDAWIPAYQTDELYEWFIQQRRND